MTTATVETVNYYQIHWEDEANMSGTYGKPVALTESELWEYMEHLHQEELHIQGHVMNEPLSTYTAVPITEEEYQEIIGSKESFGDSDDEDEELAWDKIDDAIEDYIGTNIINLFGYLDRHKVRFSMWEDILEADNSIETVHDLFQKEVINETCVIKVEGWFGEHKFYTLPIENPTWYQVVTATELGIRESGDTDHCFMEAVVKTDEVKDGLPVYKVCLGS